MRYVTVGAPMTSIHDFGYRQHDTTVGCPILLQISGTTVGEIRIVEDMHTRKAMMFAEADAFIAIPGGFGTLDETIEITTWQQLGFHTKPVGVLNMGGYYDLLLQFMDHATAEGFIRPASRAIVLSSRSAADLIDQLEAYEGKSRHLYKEENQQEHMISASLTVLRVTLCSAAIFDKAGQRRKVGTASAGVTDG